jgi:hypothetical protein
VAKCLTQGLGLDGMQLNQLDDTCGHAVCGEPIGRV